MQLKRGNEIWLLLPCVEISLYKHHSLHHHLVGSSLYFWQNVQSCMQKNGIGKPLFKCLLIYRHFSYKRGRIMNSRYLLVTGLLHNLSWAFKTILDVPPRYVFLSLGALGNWAEESFWQYPHTFPDSHTFQTIRNNIFETSNWYFQNKSKAITHPQTA